MTKVVQSMERYPTVVGSIVIIGVQTCDLKIIHMNMQCNLIWEFRLFKFKLGHNIVEETKNIFRAKEGL